MATILGGLQLLTAPPPGSGAIMAAILKIFENLGLMTSGSDKTNVKDGDIYLKVLEAFKFAYGQRTKFGDPFNNEDAEKIKKV